MVRHLAQVLLAAFVLLASGRGARRPVPPPPLPAVVHIDASGARDALALLQALNQGQTLDQQAARSLLVTKPYQVLLAYHRRLDSRVTLDSLAEMLMAVQDEKVLATHGPRLGRMHATWRWARGEVPMLQARLQQLTDPAVLERAVARARAALPPHVRLEATVYVLADGYSPSYTTENAVVLDLLQIARVDRLEAWLAHELHRIGVYTITPEPCADPDVGSALDTLAGLIQEGATTYWVDGWRARVVADDYEKVQDFIEQILEGSLAPTEAEARLSGLLAEGRGPFHRVGNRLIAALAAANGDEWVQVRLGDPVRLLRAYARLGEWPEAGALVALLNRHRGRCPEWFDAWRWWG
ncbi:MAG: hypothetical protein QME94_07470 [Anaerolineae bacterium]|nr:hypothetical protein [Anaerolineae bacterium]